MTNNLYHGDNLNVLDEPIKDENSAAGSEDQLVGDEATALASIVAWSAECPAWQRDALRRLCSIDKLGPADLDALL